MKKISKYFLNLEKRNYTNKTIKALTKKDGTRVTDSKEILNQQKDFYEKLYQSKNKCNFQMFNHFLTMIKKLSDFERSSCEGKLTFEECGLALKAMKNETSPGSNGYTVAAGRVNPTTICDRQFANLRLPTKTFQNRQFANLRLQNTSYIHIIINACYKID